VLKESPLKKNWLSLEGCLVLREGLLVPSSEFLKRKSYKKLRHTNLPKISRVLNRDFETLGINAHN